MQFTSKKFERARYVIQPRDVGYETGRPPRKIVGLAAEFRNFKWDSAEAAKTMKWTDDQRMLVESTLLLDNDFGRRNSNIAGSIWLVPQGSSVDVNVDIPDALEEFYPGLRDEVAAKLGIQGNVLAVAPEETACAQVIIKGDDIKQCGRDHIKDSTYCAQHKKMHDPDLSADDLKDALESELVPT